MSDYVWIIPPFLFAILFSIYVYLSVRKLCKEVKEKEVKA